MYLIDPGRASDAEIVRLLDLYNKRYLLLGSEIVSLSAADEETAKSSRAASIVSLYASSRTKRSWGRRLLLRIFGWSVTEIMLKPLSSTKGESP